MPKPPFQPSLVEAVKNQIGDNVVVKPREQLVEWLLAYASEADLQWFYETVISKHRDVIERILAADAPAPEKESNAVATPPVNKDGNIEDAIELPAQKQIPESVSERVLCDKADFDRSNKEPPIVQFSSQMYFAALDEEDTLSLDVIRIGNLSAASKVSYTTVDASAKSGEKFVETSGRILFSPGSNNEEINIPLIKGKHWDTTTEFKVELRSEEKPENCQLGRYLKVTRVKLIDGNCFPSNKYKDRIKERELKSIPFWGLLMEYFKLNFDNAVVRRGTTKMLCLDLAHNLYFLLKLFLNVYLVDKVLKEKPGNEIAHLLVISLCLVVPFAGLHFFDFRETTWKVGGASRGMLQNALLRKFLNYAEHCRADLKAADLIMAMTRDVTNVVHEGYVKFLELLKCTQSLFMILAFQIAAPIVFGTPPKPIGFAVLFVFPAILLTFLVCRRAKTTHYIELRNSEQDELVSCVNRTVMNYRLVADFGQRPFFEDRFKERVGNFNTAGKETNQVLKNNNYIAPWITMIFVCGYTIYGGLQVLDPDKPPKERLSLGMFLANLHIIATIGHSWGDIYKVLMAMQSISPALMQIVDLMNLPTDVPQRQALNRVRRVKSKDLREDMRSKPLLGWPADNMPVILDDLKFSYREEPSVACTTGKMMHASSHKGLDPSMAFAMTGTLELNQGAFIALVGPEGEGKSTLLKMLGGVILPKPGTLFVPSHLRVLHVASENLFFKASIFDNLTFGCSDGDPDASLQRVCKICERLVIPKDVLELVRQGREGPHLAWSDIISQSHKALLGLARAVITNPELMCIHKPIMAFNEETSKIVLDMFEEFCVNKGVEQDVASRHLRRPRTCVITAVKAQSVERADFVYAVTKADGILHVSKEKGEESMR